MTNPQHPHVKQTLQEVQAEIDALTEDGKINLVPFDRHKNKNPGVNKEIKLVTPKPDLDEIWAHEETEVE